MGLMINKKSEIMKKIKGVYISQLALVSAQHMFEGAVLSYYKGRIIMSNKTTVIETDVMMVNCQTVEEIPKIVEREILQISKALENSELKAYQDNLKKSLLFFNKLKKDMVNEALIKEPQKELIGKLYESGLIKSENSENIILISGVLNINNK